MVEYYEDGDVAVFDGLAFRKDKHTGYYLNSKTHKRLHVYIWEYYNGTIPAGYYVHHKDFDKSNNEIENLVMIEATEHLSLHGKSWDSERYEKQMEILRENAIPKASEWHGSEAGRKWHKEHYEQMKDNLYRKKTFVCEQCGKEFEAVVHGENKFCSNACKSAFRRKSGVDNEIRKCECCGKEFTTNKYSKARTCSRSCGSYMRWNKDDQKSQLGACLQLGS